MGVINCPKTMPPFGCSEIFKLFPRRVSFRETHLLESSRLLIGIGKSKSPLFLASLWLSALCEPSARGWGLLPSVTMGFWLGKGRGCLNESRSLLSPRACLVCPALSITLQIRARDSGEHGQNTGAPEHVTKGGA